MNDTEKSDPLDVLIGSGEWAHPEFAAKAEFIMESFEMPRNSTDGAQAAAAAAMGCLLIDVMAKMAVTHNLMPMSTGAAVESLVARAVECWASLAKAWAREAPDDGHTPPEEERPRREATG